MVKMNEIVYIFTDYGTSGTDYWMYDGETLDERRRRFESGE